MAPKTAPYGTWTSPITAEAITKGANSIADVIVDRVTSEIYHIESRPSEKGRNVLVHTGINRDIVDAGWNVRTAVQEYGGAPAIVHNSIAYFSHMVDGQVYRRAIGKGEEPQMVTPEGKPYRYASLEPHPTHPELIVSILEDHTVDVPASIVTTLVVIDTLKKELHTLVSGADFYALPKFTPDGKKIAWVQWNHPDMPWEGGEVHVADVSVSEGKITISNDVHVAGKHETVGAGYPTWATNDTLIFMTDESGFSQPWKYTGGKASPLFPKPVEEDFAHPLWVLHFSPYAILDKEGTTGIFSATKDGRDIFYAVDLTGGSPPELLKAPFATIDYVHTISFETEEIVFAAETATKGKSIFQASLSSLKSGEFKTLKSPKNVVVGDTELGEDLVSQPQPMSLPLGSDGDLVHVVYYPPHNPAYSGSSIDGEKPPCIVNVHGGPTGLTPQGLAWSKQYFTTRGWAWLDVNYGGSSGYGRKYIERLVNNWGLVDVRDCVGAPQALAVAPYNLVDGKRLFIRGGSAGGFTVLASLAIAPDVTVFAGGTSLYGVSDLGKLAEFTHKFESRYLDHLLGGTPAEVPQVYHDRSPINSADKIVTPLLILQGEIDMVVPKDQAEAMYKIIKERGGTVEYKLYPGEGHGWRQEANLRDALERELAFYEKVIGVKQ